MIIYFGNIKVNVIINKKKIKNIYFRFDEQMNLVINVNKSIDNKTIIKLIEKNKVSLEKMYFKVLEKSQKSMEFWYLGNKYNIIYDDSFKEVNFDTGNVYCANELTLNKFIKKQTKEIFFEEVLKLKKVIATPEFTVKIRKMKTRWGVCNYKLKTITLNSDLIKYSKEDLRYVIVHEMCHFYHHNHGPLFWNMVSKYYPNYKIARKELRS